MKSSDRNVRIDFLRGIAIFLVLLLHFHLSYNLHNSFFALILPEKLLEAIVINGNYGVTIFFAISGYLITSRAMQRYGDLQNINIRNFYTLRFARIVPCVALALFLIFLLSLFGLNSFVNKSAAGGLPQVSILVSILSVLAFWHNVLMEQYGYFNYAMNIYWSLSVEEIFYVFFPILCVILKKGWRLFALISLLIIIGPIYRYIHREDELFFMYGYLACFDAISYGCLAALIQTTASCKFFQNKFIQGGAFIFLAVTYLFGIHGNETFGFSIIAIATSILLLGSAKQLIPQNNILKQANKFVGFLGHMSYELYLFHIIILGLIRSFIPKSSLNQTGTTCLWFVFLGLSVFVAWVCYRYYSEPLNNRIRNITVNIGTEKIYDNVV